MANITQTTSKATVQASSSASSQGASQNSLPSASAENSSKSHFDYRPPKFWLALFFLVVLVAAGLGLYYFKFVANKNKAPSGQSKPLTVSSPVVGVSPSPPPAIKSENDKKFISDDFSQISTNYKPEYAAKIPQVAFDAYKKYKDASGDQKLEAARAVYIYLNAPGVSTGDEQFKQFVEDVKFEMEKTIGRKLY